MKTKVIPLTKTAKKTHWGMQFAGKLTPLCQGIVGILSTYTAGNGEPDCMLCGAVLSNMVREDRAECPEGFIPTKRPHTGGRLRKEKERVNND